MTRLDLTQSARANWDLADGHFLCFFFPFLLQWPLIILQLLSPAIRSNGSTALELWAPDPDLNGLSRVIKPSLEVCHVLELELELGAQADDDLDCDSSLSSAFLAAYYQTGTFAWRLNSYCVHPYLCIPTCTLSRLPSIDPESAGGPFSLWNVILTSSRLMLVLSSTYTDNSRSIICYFRFLF